MNSEHWAQPDKKHGKNRKHPSRGNLLGEHTLQSSFYRKKNCLVKDWSYRLVNDNALGHEKFCLNLSIIWAETPK